MKLRFAGLQQLGRALMLPIAVLPIAGLLLRLGQPDLLGWAAMASAGNAIFSNLGLLFAVGVGVGLARENHGAAGLAALDERRRPCPAPNIPSGHADRATRRSGRGCAASPARSSSIRSTGSS